MRAEDSPVDHRSAATSSISFIPGNMGASAPVTMPGSLSGARIAQRACRPQRTAPGAPEALERAGGGEVLERVGGSAGATGEVFEAGERLLGALVVDAVEERAGRPRTYRNPTRIAWIDGSACQPGRGVPIGPAASVRGSMVQSRRDACTHGLNTSTPWRIPSRTMCAVRRSPSVRVQQRARELRRVVQLDP